MMLTKEQLKISIDKYGDSSQLVNRLWIVEDDVTETVVLAPWWHPKKYIIIMILKLNY